MFDSKISTIRNFQGGEFSSIQTSSAPGFVPISCPSHPEYAITNICRSITCIQPLCPQCITAHVQLHQQTKKPPKIQNIITTRLNCLEQLAQTKFQTQTQIQQQNNQISVNLDKYLELNQKKINLIKKKINQLIDQIFQQNLKKIEIISNALYKEKDKRLKDGKVRLAPIQSYFEKVTNYKQQLQSNDYIPALLEILNQPLKKPTVPKANNIPNCGSVEINEKYLDQLKNVINQIVKVTINVNQNSNLTINRSNYHTSNNLKFSRLQQSKSNQSKLVQSRQGSKKKIFDEASSVISQYISTPKAISSNATNKAFYTGKYKINQPNYISYFKSNDNSSLVYFQQDSKNYYKTNLCYAEAGFQKITLQGNFIIPKNHRSIITPQNEVYLIGGQDLSQINQPSLSAVYRIKNYSENSLQKMASMIIGRSEFGIVYHRQNIYVFGGMTNSKQNKSQIYSPYTNKRSFKQCVTDRCQKYNITTNKWTEMKPMIEPSYNMKVCALDYKILKFGGILQTGQNLYRIDLFNTQLDIWSTLNLDQCMILNLQSIGVCQISNTQILIFGGLTRQKTPSNKCFLMTNQNLQKSIYEVFDCQDLYQQATFEEAHMFKGGVMALQNGSDNKKKLIMSFRNGQWRFVGC